MAVPDYQSIILPILKLASDGAEHRINDVYSEMAKAFELSEAERSQLLPSGKMPILNNRVAWAKTYLVKAGLLDVPRRGVIQITQRGREVLKQNPPQIDVSFLNQYPEFVDFRTASKAKEADSSEVSGSEKQTPEEALESADRVLRIALAQDLLAQINDVTPQFFERLVLELFVAMGYGGSMEDAARLTSGSGDEGIDGVIKEDRLGLDVVYLQAKRWRDDIVVGRPEIQKFVGALQGQRAKKGVFVTTSSFTSQATAYAQSVDSKVVLIDGQRLAQLMIDFNIGVSAINTYVTKRVDTDYFVEG